MRLYLIRHGETALNAERVMQGHREIPLNDRGIAQAALLARRLAAARLDHIYASDLRRATMTAAIVAAQTGVPIEYDSGFRERDPGDLTGLPYDAAMAFFTDPEFVPPNGESAGAFDLRVARAFTRLLEREAGRGRHIAVVTHGMVCGAFLRTCARRPFEEIEAIRWPNCSLTVADYNGEWNLLAVADASHLGELDRAMHPIK